MLDFIFFHYGYGKYNILPVASAHESKECRNCSVGGGGLCFAPADE